MDFFDENNEIMEITRWTQEKKEKRNIKKTYLNCLYLYFVMSSKNLKYKQFIIFPLLFVIGLGTCTMSPEKHGILMMMSTFTLLGCNKNERRDCVLVS